MSLLFKANLRLTRHYQQKLAELDSAYRSGGDAAACAISDFDSEWGQVTEKQAWCAAHYLDNPDLAAFCSQFSFYGAALLEMLGTPQDRRRWIEDAIAAVDSLPDDELIGRDEHLSTHLLHLGWIMAAEGNVVKAVQYYEQAEAIARQLLPNSLVLCRILDGRGQILLRQEHYHEAKRYFEDALDIVTRRRKNQSTESQNDTGHADECRLLNNLGFVYTGLKSYPKALDYCQKSLAIAKNTRNRRYEAIAQASIGNIYLTQGFMDAQLFEKALNHYSKAQIIYKELNNKRGKMQINLYLGQAYRGQNKCKEAERHYIEAQNMANTLKDTQFEVSAIYNRAFLYEACGRFSEGLQLAKETRSIYQRLNIPAMVADADKLINVLEWNLRQRT